MASEKLYRNTLKPKSILYYLLLLLLLLLLLFYNRLKNVACAMVRTIAWNTIHPTDYLTIAMVTGLFEGFRLFCMIL